MPSALLIVDLEGCTGVTERDPHGSYSPELRSLIEGYRDTCTREVLACIEGLKKARFTDIHVYDSHRGAVKPAGIQNK